MVLVVVVCDFDVWCGVVWCEGGAQTVTPYGPEVSADGAPVTGLACDSAGNVMQEAISLFGCCGSYNLTFFLCFFC